MLTCHDSTEMEVYTLCSHITKLFPVIALELRLLHASKNLWETMGKPNQKKWPDRMLKTTHFTLAPPHIPTHTHVNKVHETTSSQE